MEKGSTFVLRYDPGEEGASPSEKPENTIINPNVVQALPRLQPQLVPQALPREPAVVSKTASNKSRKKYIIGIAAALVVCVMAMALVLVVVYGPLANNLNQESTTLEGDFDTFKTQYETDAETLKREIRSEFQAQIQQLTTALNTTKYKLSMAETRITLLSDSVVTVQDNSISVNTIAHNNADVLGRLNARVNSIASNGTVTSAQFNAIQASVNELRTSRDSTNVHFNSLQSVVNSINTAQHTITNQVQEFNVRINTPVNIYQNCSEETRSCTVSASYNYYARYCTTNSLPANTTVSQHFFNIIQIYILHA